MAAQEGYVDVVTVLLEQNADPNKSTTDDRITPLCMAAEYGHVDVVVLLVKHNADPNQARKIATRAGHTAVLDLLKEHGI